MNILFISITRMKDLQGVGIYHNLMREIRDRGHNLYVVSAYERKFHLETSMKEVDGIHLLGVKTLNNLHTNMIEKGVSMMTLESLYKRAIKKYMGDVSFDIILSSTPPIMLTNVVRFMKKRNPKAITYLLLKDIFPQNAVDLGMFRKNSFMHRYFRKKEIALYKNSDYIGCMSPANVEYVIRNNSFVDPSRVEVAPNCVDVTKTYSESFSKEEIKKKYGLPLDCPIFVYGGSLGKPQGVSYLIECMEENRSRKDCHFVIVGNGTEYKRLRAWMDNSKPESVSLFEYLPKEDYDKLVQSSDVGLIFLDHRFTIPNYPSRLLAYQENKKPILAATDPVTDIGRIAEENGYGYWCESNDPQAFTAIVDKMLHSDIKAMGERGYEFLINNYLPKHTYEAIIKHVK